MNGDGVRGEIPDTKQGLKLYIEYCNKTIKEMKLHIQRLERRIDWCHEKNE